MDQGKQSDNAPSLPNIEAAILSVALALQESFDLRAWAGADVDTSESTTSTSYVGLATPQTVTVNVGANGLLFVAWGTQSNNSAANFNSCSIALSGANTVAASDNYRILSNSTVATAAGMTKLFTGLAPGSTTVTLQFKASAGTATFALRTLSAVAP